MPVLTSIISLYEILVKSQYNLLPLLQKLHSRRWSSKRYIPLNYLCVARIYYRKTILIIQSKKLNTTTSRSVQHLPRPAPTNHLLFHQGSSIIQVGPRNWIWRPSCTNDRCRCRHQGIHLDKPMRCAMAQNIASLNSSSLVGIHARCYRTQHGEPMIKPSIGRRSGSPCPSPGNPWL